MTYFRQIAAAAGTVLLTATLGPERGAAQASSGVEGTVWVRTSPAEPGGTFRIFLPTGTHVTGSCGETYRLDRWRSVTPTRLIVTEDVGHTMKTGSVLYGTVQIRRNSRTL